MSQTDDQVIDLAELERKYDPEMAFRPTGKAVAALVTVALVAMSLYHYYAAGFGLVRELIHRGIHISFVLGLIFIVFGATRRENDTLHPSSVLRPGGIGIWDWLFGALAVVAALYLPLLPASAISVRV
ncbi:MAG: TRAP transporter permease, partial [Hoeflea sp.]|nr:TRAP transporter permease [Hoeflea sp.]